jgi:hypothetical protein
MLAYLFTVLPYRGLDVPLPKVHGPLVESKKKIIDVLYFPVCTTQDKKLSISLSKKTELLVSFEVFYIHFRKALLKVTSLSLCFFDGSHLRLSMS